MTTRTRVLSWDDIKDTADTPASLHDDLSASLVYYVSFYYRSMGTGRAYELAYAREKLRRAEHGYWATFDANPREIIDVQDPAVIAAHAHHIADMVFNSAADAVAAASAKLFDLDNDRRRFGQNSELHDALDRCMHTYRRLCPSGPTTSTELVQLRRALSVRVIPS
ncbi:hypothetical protein [Nocardiopsis tropica]|uniref:Uncharacterized protein n=1 Tax=Nocardiopsis tropica TaxID=109330 RepID=A0ABU7KT16_9ACTN|nr:hypothetical protein [Nocardiopsis umidischolae]MEE2051792.1 hypothetical protein [Nocardiopsis umidischolae]